ncbi:MAG: efflux transporter outer membrane subunit [Methylovulum sp.]
MRRRQWIYFCGALLSGCTVGPDYQRPELPAPKQWSQTTERRAQVDKWWQTFNDPVLNRLMTDAIAANLDLKQALIRIKDARAQRAATFASALPDVSGRSNVSRRLNNSSTSSQTGGGNPAVGGFGVGDQVIDIFQTGFDAQWELDFFGGVRRAVEAADATVEAEVENSRAVLVTLLGEVARNYIELRANQQLIAISRETLVAQQDTLDLTEARQQSGLGSTLEVAQAQAQIAATQAQLPVYETLVRQSIYALSLLLGREPAGLSVRLIQPDSIPAVATTVIPDLPSELLKRRPDIRRAERNMAVANAYVGIATAELYPRVNLSAFLGLQNMRISDMTPIGKSWSTAASVSMPIFNWGRLSANIKSKEAQSELAFLSYKSAVLTAFKEVEDALVAYSREQQRHKALMQAVDANQLALQLANERYQKGLTGFLDVLDSQQSLYQAQSNRVDSEAKISGNLVALYKALGGGWQTEASVDGSIGEEIAKVHNPILPSDK